MAKPTIFISYSHKDEEWKNRLVTHWSVLQQQDYLDIWVDTRIEGGADWYQEIKEAIDTTSIVVLLISADFLKSKFITEKEVPLLLQQQQEKGLRIFPIILKPCDWLGVPWIAKSMARPKDGRPLSAGKENQIETDLASIAREIRELLQRAGLPREQQEYVPLPPDQISLSKLPTTHYALFGRDKEVKRLDDAWANPHCHVLCFVAFGGVGKTALVNEWLNRIELDNWRGAERVYGWSFYSQGTREDRQASADTFFEDALRFFGYTGEPLKSPWDKGKLLASLIKERKTLLILDGLEPLQYPPGIEEGRLRDQGLQALLKELARFNNGLCLITTRCKVTDIEHTLEKTTYQIELENLSPQAGMQLLREAGVTQGTDQELQGAAIEYGCHALALTLLGRYLAIRYSGEIRKRDSIKKLAYNKDRYGIHARHVMDSYELWLNGTAELDLLYIMGLFDRPTQLGAIETLKQQPVIEGLTDSLQRQSDEDWDFAIQRLRDLRLLSSSEPATLDCHPLVREHFAEKLKAKSKKTWKEAHSRLYDYYKGLPEKLYSKYLPDTSEEMEPLFSAVAHGCQAGRHQEALNDVFWSRIRREKKHYDTWKLGIYGLDLSAIFNFFKIPWIQPVDNLKENEQADILKWSGFDLTSLGRLKEAMQSFEEAKRRYVIIKDWKNASDTVGLLSELCLTLGHVKQAINYAQKSVFFADKTREENRKYIQRTLLANSLFQLGKLKEAENLFKIAESMQKQAKPKYPFLFSVAGFRFCALLLNQGYIHEVNSRAIKTLKWAYKDHLSLLSIALDELSIGITIFLLNMEKSKSIAQAINHLNNAVYGLHKAGQLDYLPFGLLTRATFYRMQCRFQKSWEDLEELREIAERGNMNLHLVDYHLEASRLLISEFGFQNADKAEELNRDEMVARLKNHVEQAAELVQKTGYHRRDPEVELGYVDLFFAQGDQVKAREHLGKAKALLDKMGIRCWDFEVRRLEEAIG